MSEVLTGLSSQDVDKKIRLGLSNSVIDTYSPSLSLIFIRNTFSVINIVVFPLLIFLAYFNLYMEVFTFGFFIIINTATSLFDEIRIKLEIDRLKKQFEIRSTVIRDEIKVELPVNEIVEDDLCFAKEGDQIVADGKIVRSSYLQLDESVISGESDYIQKSNGDKVFSSTFIVTGECYYTVTSVGTSNYTNKLAQATTKYQKNKSPLQKNADRLIFILIILAIGLGILNFITTSLNSSLSMQIRILSVTSITALIIPQTLIFLFTLTFSISISKLFSKGVLVQRGASIENLANTNIICFDKTGTITTNKMDLSNTLTFGIDEFELGRFYSSCSSKLFGISKTQSLLTERYSDHKRLKILEFDQKPFTSKDKYSYFTAFYKGEYEMFVLGAPERLLELIEDKTDINNKISEFESLGKRLLLGIHLRSKNKIDDPFKKYHKETYIGAILYIIDEQLNTGIKEIINKLNELGIMIKIISGDSFNSVKTIASKVGLDTKNIVDLSKQDIDLEQVAVIGNIFTRAKPEDKLKIISILKEKGNTVAMIGDGVNDVLSMKAADVSISMENGAKVTRSTSDMVLLKNDYKRLPDIFNEGDNIIFNLKLSTKLFLAKSLFAIITALVFIAILSPFPIHPSSTLIFSFYGASLPSYILIFSRQKLVKQSKSFFGSIFSSSIPAAVIMSLITISLNFYLTSHNINERSINTIQSMQLLIGSLIYALFVLYKAGKIRDKRILVSAFSAGMYLGLIQTILPVDFNSSTLMIIFTLFSISLGSIAILIIGFKYFSGSSLTRTFLVILTSIIWFLILSIFPFDEYYHVTTLKYAEVFILMIIFSIYMLFFSLEMLLWRIFFKGSEFKDNY